MGNKSGKQKKKNKTEEEATEKQTNGKVEDKPVDGASAEKPADDKPAETNENKDEKGGGEGADDGKEPDKKEEDTPPEQPVTEPPKEETTEPAVEDKPVENGDVQSETVATEFRWEEDGETVLVTGSFNDWKDQVPLKKNGENVFMVTLDLPKGEHLYKFLVDDKWLINKKNPVKVADDGLENNIIVVC